jgi:hypothetical protein
VYGLEGKGEGDAFGFECCYQRRNLRRYFLGIIVADLCRNIGTALGSIGNRLVTTVGQEVVATALIASSSREEANPC